VPIIEPLDPGKDAVPPKLNEEGVVITPGEPAIPPEKPGDYIRWRTIADRSSEGSDGNPQVIVEEMESDQEDETGRKRKFVKVRGNAVNESHNDVGLFNINVVDGLVTLFAPKVQTGKNLNLTINAKDYNSEGTINQPSEPPYAVAVLYWRNGLYVGDVNPADAPAQLDEHTVTLLQMGE
jgi:hypothetical protein